jgi:hypothetical protein
VERLQASVARGQPAEWLVGAWATGGNASAATVRLSVAPAGQKATFSVGCSPNGTASCKLGGLTSGSTVKLLQARVVVPKTATSVTSVRLTATAGAGNATTDPKATVAISLTTPGTPTVPAQVTPLGGSTGISPIAAGYMPFLSGTGAKLNPGGDASSLFPALSPSTAAPSPSPQRGQVGRPVADLFPAPKSESVADAQLAGLAVLALAVVLGAAGLITRKRRTPKPAATDGGSPA